MTSLDSDKKISEHKRAIQTKPILREVYTHYYKEIKKHVLPKGKNVEIGSGGGFIKKVTPNIITSDVVAGAGIDKVFSVEKMPFAKNTISSFGMLNVFHHVKSPRKALLEMRRCLVKGGKIVLIEPYNSLWGRFVYQNFHHEQFNPQSNWKIKGKGRLSDANGAIPWIIFVRDRAKFEKEFSDLKIVSVRPHTPFSYLISGGLSKPQLLPTFVYPLIKSFEALISPLNPYLGMFVTIELEKV